jgi:hypothetical protein
MCLKRDIFGKLTFYYAEENKQGNSHFGAEKLILI